MKEGSGFGVTKSPHHVIHTDDFMDTWGFKDFPTRMIQHLKDQYDGYSGSIIVEGVQVARLLRTGHREGIWTPEMVVWVVGGDPDNKISPMTKKAFREWKQESKSSIYKVQRGL